VVALRARAADVGWDGEAIVMYEIIMERVDRLRGLGWPAGGLGARP